jgi:hypothetical protein
MTIYHAIKQQLNCLVGAGQQYFGFVFPFGQKGKFGGSL